MKTRLNIFYIFLFCLPLTANCQFIKKSSILFNGTLGVNNSKYSPGPKTFGFSTNAFGGYFPIDNLLCGLGIDFSFVKSQISAPPVLIKNKFTSYSVGPLVRYYFEKGLFIHGQFYLTKAHYSDNYDSRMLSSDYKRSATGNKYQLGAGYAVRITDTVLLEPLIVYQRSSSNLDGIGSYKGISLLLSINILLNK